MLRIFEAIKKSPFLNGNFLLSSPSANASAENGKFKMKDERGKRKHVIPPSLIRRGMESLMEDFEGRDDNRHCGARAEAKSCLDYAEPRGGKADLVSD